MTVVKAAACGADKSWPVRGVQKGNSRLVTEAARIPALTLAVGAQLDCVTGTTAVAGVDSNGDVAPDVADCADADISHPPCASKRSQEATAA